VVFGPFYSQAVDRATYPSLDGCLAAVLIPWFEDLRVAFHTPEIHEDPSPLEMAAPGSQVRVAPRLQFPVLHLQGALPLLLAQVDPMWLCHRRR